MIRSMTGFGMADGTVGAKRVTVEVRTVNHRFFNPSIKMPGVFSQWESDVREALRKRIARGHVSVTVRQDSTAEEFPTIDDRRFASYVAQLQGLKDRHSLGGELSLDTVLRMPGLFAPTEAVADSSSAELLAVLDGAVEALTVMRADEGARLAGRAPVRMVEQRDRLRAAVKELLDSAEIDEQRMAQEIAMLASRLDVSEEIYRFRSHIAAFRAAMRDEGGDPVGKRLGFLLQELLREANTTGSKANDAAMLGDVVTIKEELERIREQVENLE